MPYEFIKVHLTKGQQDKIISAIKNNSPTSVSLNVKNFSGDYAVLVTANEIKRMNKILQRGTGGMVIDITKSKIKLMRAHMQKEGSGVLDWIKNGAKFLFNSVIKPVASNLYNDVIRPQTKKIGEEMGDEVVRQGKDMIQKGRQRIGFGTGKGVTNTPVNTDILTSGSGTKKKRKGKGAYDSSMFMIDGY